MSDVIIPAVHETRVYLNEDGDVVIRQTNVSDEDDYVAIPVLFAKVVADAIMRVAGGE